MVKCDLLCDREMIISNGPWKLSGHYIVVSNLTLEFTPPSTTVEGIMVSICFLGLNIVYSDESFPLAFRAAIWKPVRGDVNTVNVECGHFASTCVEVDLTKPDVC